MGTCNVPEGWCCGCRVWDSCIANDMPNEIQDLGFRWFVHVVGWPLPPHLSLNLLTNKMVHLLPRLNMSSWSCFLAFFRQVLPAPVSTLTCRMAGPELICA